MTDLGTSAFLRQAYVNDWGCHRKRELLVLVQWKAGAGSYVLSVEPATCTPAGRAQTRAPGDLVEPTPGESRDDRVEINVRGSVS